MQTLLAVAGGGALGALARYGCVNAVYLWWGRAFPVGTLAVNVLGSFAAGVLYVLLLERWAAGSEWRGLLLVGFLGSFTTFSAFSVETMQLFERSAHGAALANVAANVVLCIGACGLGLWVARSVG